MHVYYKAKEMLHKELEDIVNQGEINNISLEMIDKLLNSIKNSCKIIMYEEYSEDGEYSYEDGYSNARGRGRNARRDSRGRYARESGYSYEDGGYSNEGYSNRRGDRGGYSRRGGYSYDDGEKEEKMQMLQELMRDADSEQDKKLLRKMMQEMQNS